MKSWFYSNYSAAQLDDILVRVQGWAKANQGRAALAAQLDALITVEEFLAHEHEFVYPIDWLNAE